MSSLKIIIRAGRGLQSRLSSDFSLRIFLELCLLSLLSQMFKKEKMKGVEGLVEIENPNRVAQKSKKVTDIDMDAKVMLSRRER